MAVRELNTKEAQAGFGVAHMTLYNYRQPREGRDPLPSEVKGGHRVFKLTDCVRWAKKNGLEFTEPKVIPLGSVGRKPAEAKAVKKVPAKKSAARVAVAKKAAPAKTAAKKVTKSSAQEKLDKSQAVAKAKPKTEKKPVPRAARVPVQPAEQQQQAGA